jgi:hypothetical protein
MKASRIVSSDAASSPGSSLAGIARRSGIGSSHVCSDKRALRGASPGDGSVRSIGSARRFLPFSMLMDTLVAMR